MHSTCVYHSSIDENCECSVELHDIHRKKNTLRALRTSIYLNYQTNKTKKNASSSSQNTDHNVIEFINDLQNLFSGFVFLCLNKNRKNSIFISQFF